MYSIVGCEESSRSVRSSIAARSSSARLALVSKPSKSPGAAVESPPTLFPVLRNDPPPPALALAVGKFIVSRNRVAASALRFNTSTSRDPGLSRAGIVSFRNPPISRAGYAPLSTFPTSAFIASAHRCRYSLSSRSCVVSRSLCFLYASTSRTYSRSSSSFRRRKNADCSFRLAI